MGSIYVWGVGLVNDDRRTCVCVCVFRIGQDAHNYTQSIYIQLISILFDTKHTHTHTFVMALVSLDEQQLAMTQIAQIHSSTENTTTNE